MNLLDPAQTHGWDVKLLRNNPRQFDSQGLTGPLGGSEKGDTFESLLSKAVEGVNAAQIKSTDLYQQMIVAPNTVDAHDITIAAAEATMSLNMAKTVVERALQAYRDIINMR
ncbi:MAG: flagellar hook-basal body complex protein FliE [Spirochaetales bacterium]|nr:flagellar hook-basal body complex protein FliE [Spirochaetales bacterium]